MVAIPGARTIRSLAELQPENDPRDYFIIGGAQIFETYLPECSEVYLTKIKRYVEGEIFLMPFEDRFECVETITDTPDFSILHYKRGGSC